MTPEVNAPVPPQKNWLARNWMWAVPVGCGLPVICCGVFGLVTYFAAGTMTKMSGVTIEAVARAQANEDVTRALGSPLTAGFSMSGSIEEKNGAGVADFSVPLTGPKGEGRLFVKAVKAPGEPWLYSTLEVEAKGQRISLAEDPIHPGGGSDLLPADVEPLLEVDCETACAHLKTCSIIEESAADCVEGCKTLVTPDVSCAEATADCAAIRKCLAQFE